MYKIRILPFATKDVKEAAVWYNQKQRGLGLKFTREVRNKVNQIAQNPLASAVRYKSVRTSILSIFPYMIHYTIDESKDVIIIIAVLHTSRNPLLWSKRGKNQPY